MPLASYQSFPNSRILHGRPFLLNVVLGFASIHCKSHGRPPYGKNAHPGRRFGLAVLAAGALIYDEGESAFFPGRRGALSGVSLESAVRALAVANVRDHVADLR